MLVLKNQNGGVVLAQVIGKNGHVIFSLDGLKDTNHLYRQNVNWDICMDPSTSIYRCRR